MAFGYLRMAGESIVGNETNSPTLATAQCYPPLLSWENSPGFSHLMRDDELRNLDEPLSAFVEAADPSWSLETRMYPNTLGYLFSYMLGAPTTTAGNGVITDPGATVIPVGATRHVWTAPFGPTGSEPKTFQADASYKDQSTYFKLKGCATSALSIETPDTGGARVKASGPALYMVRGSDPALTPTFETITVTPFTKPMLTLSTWLSGSADFEDFSIALDNPVTPVHSGGSASRWPDKCYKGDSPITLTGSVPKNLIDPDDYDALVGATGFSAQARWTSTSIIASSYPYKLFVEMSNCQYVDGGPRALSNSRRIGADFSFKATRSASASSTITLVNTVPSYA